VGVDVDQARGDDLAARIDGLGGVGRDVGLDRRDPAAGDRHVAHRVKPDGRINDAASLDDEIVGRGGGRRNAGEQRGAGADKLASVHHGSSPVFSFFGARRHRSRRSTDQTISRVAT